MSDSHFGPDTSPGGRCTGAAAQGPKVLAQKFSKTDRQNSGPQIFFVFFVDPQDHNEKFCKIKTEVNKKMATKIKDGRF